MAKRNAKPRAILTGWAVVTRRGHLDSNARDWAFADNGGGVDIYRSRRAAEFTRKVDFTEPDRMRVAKVQIVIADNGGTK